MSDETRPKMTPEELTDAILSGTTRHAAAVLAKRESVV